MDITEFARNAIGTPFVKYGRDFDGWDCYGLCVVAHRMIKDCIIPDFARYSLNDKNAIEVLFDDRNKSFWKPVEPSPMAVACIYRKNKLIHCGLVIPGDKILHVESGVATVAETFNNFRIEGFYAVNK